jgi:uncharacterized protein YraI
LKRVAGGPDEAVRTTDVPQEEIVNKILMSAAALCALLAAPSIASAAVQGFATANVNMRSGPSTSYPAVTVIPVGAPVTIYGCMSSVNWCDVTFVGGRGWVSGSYVQTSYRSNRVAVAPDYYQGLGIPSVTFEVDNYWDRYYRDRNFYRERDRWRRYDWRAERPLPPPRWDNDRRPPPPRWDDDRRPPPPPRWDNDRRPQQWDRDRDRDRYQDRDRNPDRDGRRPPPRMDDDNRRPQADRDPGRNRDDRDRNRDRGRDQGRNQDRDQGRNNDRDQGRNQDRNDAPRREWGGMREQNGVICTGPARDCR